MNNVIDMQSYREKKSAKKAAEERSQQYLDSIAAELVEKFGEVGLKIQEIGDLVQQGHIE